MTNAPVTDEARKRRKQFVVARCVMKHFTVYLDRLTHDLYFRAANGNRKERKLPPAERLHLVGTYLAPCPTEHFEVDLEAALQELNP